MKFGASRLFLVSLPLSFPGDLSHSQELAEDWPCRGLVKAWQPLMAEFPKQTYRDINWLTQSWTAPDFLFRIKVCTLSHELSEVTFIDHSFPANLLAAYEHRPDVVDPSRKSSIPGLGYRIARVRIHVAFFLAC